MRDKAYRQYRSRLAWAMHEGGLPYWRIARYFGVSLARVHQMNHSGARLQRYQLYHAEEEAGGEEEGELPEAIVNKLVLLWQSPAT